MEKVSIIIPVFNRTQFLEEALMSVARQTHPSYEVILVNDGSRLGVSKTLLELCEKYPFAQMIEMDQHHGVSYARNRGIEGANGDFIHFLDDDDKIAPNLFSKAISYLHTGKEEAVITQTELFSDQQRSKKFQRQVKIYNHISSAFGGYSPDHWSYFLIYTPAIHAIIFRKEVFQEVQFEEDLSYGEDRFLWMKLRKKGVAFHKLAMVGAQYRIHNDHSAGESKNQQHYFEKLNSSDLISSKQGKNYIYTFLCLLSFRRGLLLQSVTYKLKALTHPFLFIKHLMFLLKGR